MIIQLTGLSGCGKTTLSNKVKVLLAQQNLSVEILDGDRYRQTLCKDLGFSKADRQENVRRLGKLASSISHQYDVVIVAAINPYEETRAALKAKHSGLVIWIDCAMDTLIERDTKGLYKRALLPDGHPEKINNLSGVNDVYENPSDYDLVIRTHIETVEASAEKLYQFIKHLF